MQRRLPLGYHPLLAALLALSLAGGTHPVLAEEALTADEAAARKAADEKAKADAAAQQKTTAQTAADQKAAAEKSAKEGSADQAGIETIEKFELPGDEVTLKNGSLIIGEIVTMTGDSLVVKTPSAGDVKIAWPDVTSVKSLRSATYILADGTTLKGVAQPAGPGRIDIKAEKVEGPSTVALSSIKAINPPEKKAVTHKGNLGLGFSMSRGNTNTRNFSVVADYEARSERHRLTFNGNYNYADDEQGMIAQNGRAALKYDFFITKRFYIFANALVEHDKFADLSLRTALGAGPGYQFIDKGDFKPDWLTEMQLWGEVGLAYFNEDYYTPDDPTAPDPDKSYVAGRWALKFDWPFVPKKIAFFHYDEGYPALDSSHDLYISTQTGFRFNIWNGLVATAQVNWKWNSAPALGFERGDTLYLLTLGYSFEL
jgi:putative salt-induced outer membrane protein YdiY